MNFNRSLLYGLMCGIFSLTACGGGGSAAAPQTPTATLRLSTSVPQGTSLAGIGVTITLPAGVTIRLDAGGAVASGVVTVTGVAAPGSVISVYTPGNPATLALAVVSQAPAGFGTGEFATVTCELASSAIPPASAFALALNPFDLGGNPVTGLTASVTVN